MLAYLAFVVNLTIWKGGENPTFKSTQDQNLRVILKEYSVVIFGSKKQVNLILYFSAENFEA